MKKNVWKSLITCSTAALLSIGCTTIVNAAWQLTPNVGWWYQEGDTYYTGWHTVENKWYYFDQYGWMQTGWLKDGPDWYYLDSTGAMLVNAWAGDYYMGNRGAMVTET